MNNEKLKSLTHKLVELNTSTDHLKGFLFRDNDGDYFIKPIEVYKGSAKEAGKFFLDEDHIEFTNFCESPKLMKVSMKSWHYRLMKYVLRSNTPTPKTMQNGCPYFWLLIFSILVFPFVSATRGLFTLFLGVPYLFWKIMENIADNVLSTMPDEKAYDIGIQSYYGNTREVPILARISLNHERERFLAKYVKVKYGIDAYADRDAYDRKIEELKLANAEYWQKRSAKEAKERELQLERSKKEAEIQKVRDLKARACRERSRLFWKPFNDRMNSIGQGISRAMTFNLSYNRNSVIKRTKQFVGFIVTLIVLAATVGVVSGATFMLMSLVDGLTYLGSNHLDIILIVLGAIAGACVLVALGYVVLHFIQNTISKYESGIKTWYAQIVVYGLVYPIKYLVLSIAWFFFYAIDKPIEFIFYTVIFKVVLVNLGIFLWGLLRALGGVVLGSMGIFGEYFGASKKDYCPGIEWTDVD